MAFESMEGASNPTHSPGRLLPKQDILLDLREKLLSVFDVASVLASKTLPLYCLQRDITPPVLGPDRAPVGPFPGNDFHVFPSIVFEPESWAACLQFEDGVSAADDPPRQPLQVPLSHHKYNRPPGANAVEDVEAAAKRVLGLWPDDGMTPTWPRWRLGPQLSDPQSPLYHTYHWLCSKPLNGEVVDARILSWSPGTGRLVDGQFDRPPLPSWCTEPDPRPEPSAEIWSISNQDPMVLSFPTLACILCLMSDPSKPAGQNPGDVCADRDLSWCLDALHGLCRLKGPAEDERDLSHSLGTSPGHWMYLNFIFHHFVADGSEAADPPPKHHGSGLRADRRSVTISISPGRKATFTESRRWIGARVATTFKGKAPSMSPASVLLSVSDSGHPSARMREQDWDKSGLKSPARDPGVALFMQFLWGSLGEWEAAWGRSLDHLDKAFGVAADDLTDDAIESLLSTDVRRRAATCLAALQLLHFFRAQIKAVPRSLRKMHGTWERTYVGERSGMLDRFDRDAQRTFLQNWGRLLAHADAAQGGLLGRIREVEERIKDLRLHASAT
ncbi:hypothetical protein MKZ38_005059 [Zalerion maritima]|uniref:Uncharacterized protein n=1 Tax=Zalerion maritima TaxID=339359 RepID=A0AAD5RKU1_9PEZI|nr:hypothetical protein MKZ38_005059 [Zalerion maritima]